MSISRCPECGDIFDTDFELEVNKNGDCICDKCAFAKELGGHK